MSREERKKRWGFWEWFRVGSQENPMLDRLRLLQTPWFGIYVHFIHREDLDLVPHDHPWNFWRMVLRGGYVENFFDDPIEGEPLTRYLGAWQPNRITVDQAHRITWVAPKTVSLVLVGKKQRTWGFWTPEDLSLVGDGYGWESRSWIDYRDYLRLRPATTEAEKDRRIFDILQKAIHPVDRVTLKPLPIEESIRRAKAMIAESDGPALDLTEGCSTGGCSCMGHRMAGVRHMVPCCDTPHIDQMGLAPASDVSPSAP